tara:strand:+ start:5441 stop:6592 length:1152 start_codon:yes stop_codon:yes gene_type:complete
MLGLAHRGFRLNDYGNTLNQFLRNHGWHTALTGVQHLAKEPYATLEELGYDEYLDHETDSSGKLKKLHGINSSFVTRTAEEFLARDHDKPFFLDVGFFPPHRVNDGDFPMEVDRPNPNYVCPPAHLPDTAETREDYANYMASVTTFDHYAGRVFEAIEENGLSENTLVIATTDHGIAFPGMKCRLTDHGIGVFLILKGPNGFNGGKVTDSIVSHLDLFPTVCDVLELDAPDRLEGTSLVPLANDPESAVREEIFAEVNFHAAYEPMRAIRTSKWKYIRHFDPRDHVTLPNCDNGLTKSLLCDEGWASRPVQEEELYDLTFDPTESCNLAADPQYSETLLGLKGRLSGWMKETSDPILSGPLDASEVITVDVRCYSPSGEPRKK